MKVIYICKDHRIGEKLSHVILIRQSHAPNERQSCGQHPAHFGKKVHYVKRQAVF